ncbi:SDR family NAD(P)-dependent oxidoreductase [Ancylobacter terrae]|uniref:SDR family NAD(P)-dependent oxidoreductase n=1 Tax=Ancylobacter sp. sgz301288 TaxID=3342077 RepID=UPI00385B128C
MPPPPAAGHSPRVIFVTGATSGIGAATALAFARRGDRVIVTGRDRGRGASIEAACRRVGADALFLACDVTVSGAVEGAIARTLDRFGRLDVAVNNAGFQERSASLLEQDDAIYAQVFDTNVRAVLAGMRAQIAAMLAGGGGSIVNVASVSGVRNPYPGFALYGASKAALLHLTRAAAAEFAPSGIRINAVSPGRIHTPMMAGNGVPLDAVAAALPSRRLGEAAEVAEAIVWIAGADAAFVIGHNLCVDGGFLAG